jgi:hypothetical protein
MLCLYLAYGGMHDGHVWILNDPQRMNQLHPSLPSLLGLALHLEGILLGEMLAFEWALHLQGIT